MFRVILYVIVLFISVNSVAGGECCKEYTDHYGTTHDSQYCSTYCCDDNTFWYPSKSLKCCSSSSRRTSSDNRIDSCGWWENNSSWAIALIVIGNLSVVGGCIACCVGCAKGCCGQNHRTGVVMANPQQTTVVTSQMGQMSQNQGAQYPPSGYYGNQPPPYPSGSYGNQPPPPPNENQGVPPPPQKY